MSAGDFLRGVLTVVLAPIWIPLVYLATRNGYEHADWGDLAEEDRPSCEYCFKPHCAVTELKNKTICVSCLTLRKRT